MDFINRLTNTAAHLSKEDFANITKLTFIKEIYGCWESNDEGENFDLYTGLAVDGVTPRYFLKHFRREWLGGWSYDETTTWYEIPQQELLKLYPNNKKT